MNSIRLFCRAPGEERLGCLQLSAPHLTKSHSMACHLVTLNPQSLRFQSQFSPLSLFIEKPLDLMVKLFTALLQTHSGVVFLPLCVPLPAVSWDVKSNLKVMFALTNIHDDSYLEIPCFCGELLEAFHTCVQTHTLMSPPCLVNTAKQLQPSKN